MKIEMEKQVVDDPKRDVVPSQEHEVAYIMRTENVTRQRAVEAVREAGPSRKNMRDHLKRKWKWSKRVD
ncbi:DUF3606 domain-containing protein [Sinorhizobium sp. CCBAU 05631]|uniref:DUF3606 domain-containing protein n=1 Tax=Sinorhizobium sp. CCBAU 05631 TaxID=794846 RepID=UPI0004B59BB5|nr:DUF3606 domain-containing protein [Sinorhizobium sp. CCBAU 05631]ASY56362.1 hypothetical protein SS05631_c14240 [Sinorhizobium sp. CCBAU 05631]